MLLIVAIVVAAVMFILNTVLFILLHDSDRTASDL